MSKKIILTITAVVLVLVFVIYQVFIKKEEPNFVLEKVSRGQISQEVSETGTVKATEEINLGFNGLGRIEKIYVKTGDNVESGQSLAKLDTSQLNIQLIEAKANFEIAQAKLNKLLAGSSPEEIKIAETAVANANLSFEDAKQNLKDVTALATESLKSAYEDALNVVEDCYLSSYNALNKLDSIQTTYFNSNDQESIKMKENKSNVEDNVLQIKSYLDLAKSNSSHLNIDTALSKTKTGLNNISTALENSRQLCEESSYQNVVTSTDKTSLDTQRTNINTALTNVTNSQQLIISTNLDNEYDINTAKSQVSTTEGQLKATQDELALKKAAARQEDIDLYEAQVKQAQSKVALLEDQIYQSTLRSPTKSQITKVNKKAGETIQITENMLSLIPLTPFQVKVDIYEEDIIKVKVENPVDIVLAAFPDETLKGKVVSIDPTEKLIDGVVYYEVTIDFEEQKQELKPGMTADLTIKTAFKENVLIFSEDALSEKDGKNMVQVFKEGLIEEREIQIGLEGSDDKVEVLSGLEEGEEVIIK
ncbi:efflux RND transporter periplasmic adaptor subunit [Patescibacteria group bacterium]